MMISKTTPTVSVASPLKQRYPGNEVPFAYLQPLLQERRIDNVLQNGFLLDSLHQARSLILQGVVKLNGIKVLASL